METDRTQAIADVMDVVFAAIPEDWATCAGIEKSGRTCRFHATCIEAQTLVHAALERALDVFWDEAQLVELTDIGCVKPKGGQKCYEYEPRPSYMCDVCVETQLLEARLSESRLAERSTG